MQKEKKIVGVLGLGSMGGNVARLLHREGYELVLYDRNSVRYEYFSGYNDVHTSTSIETFGKQIAEHHAKIIWMMLPGGEVTNNMILQLRTFLPNETIVIDGSNSLYEDSIKNNEILKQNSIKYLDVGCAGGPEDLKNGVALMIGGDKTAFIIAEEVFKVVCGKGTYGYVGNSGAGHATKLVHNIIFYSIFPAYAEGIAILDGVAKSKAPIIDMERAIELLSKSPPITVDIMTAMLEVVKKKELPVDIQEIKISEIVRRGVVKAQELGVKVGVTNAIIKNYGEMPHFANRIYIAAKRIITGH